MSLKGERQGDYPEEEAYILEKAYVPEHITNLMGPSQKEILFSKRSIWVL